MKREFLLIILLLPYLHCISQERGYRVSLYSEGASYENVKDPNPTERYGQWQKVALELTLSEQLAIQGGLARSRNANIDFVEFPLLFSYQMGNKVRVFSGVQAEFTVDRRLGAPSVPQYLRSSIIGGVNYNFTDNLDAGIQFSIPFNESSTLRNATYELAPPIRLRTGIKF